MQHVADDAPAVGTAERGGDTLRVRAVHRDVDVAAGAVDHAHRALLDRLPAGERAQHPVAARARAARRKPAPRTGRTRARSGAAPPPAGWSPPPPSACPAAPGPPGVPRPPP